MSLWFDYLGLGLGLRLELRLDIVVLLQRRTIATPYQANFVELLRRRTTNIRDIFVLISFPCSTKHIF